MSKLKFTSIALLIIAINLAWITFAPVSTWTIFTNWIAIGYTLGLLSVFLIQK